MNTPPRANLTAIILAGGRGSRMEGRDKGLAPFCGRPLFMHTAAVLAAHCAHVVVSANRHIDEYARHGYPVVSDEAPDYQGPLSGLWSALRQVKTAYFVWAPCDTPWLPPDLIPRLWQALVDTPSPAAICHDGVRQQPLIGLGKANLAVSLADYLQNGGRKAVEWTARVGAVQVDFSHLPLAFTNTNTVAELHALQDMQRDKDAGHTATDHPIDTTCRAWKTRRC